MPFDEILTNVKPCELPVGLCAQAWSTTTAPSGAPPRSSIKPGKFNPLPSKHQRNKSWNKNEKIILLDQKLMLFYFKLNQINSNQLESTRITMRCFYIAWLLNKEPKSYFLPHFDKNYRPMILPSVQRGVKLFLEIIK